ncbi:hypothetical protein IMX07_14975 [bacterium]|nr:hypothetical protein [bacterium]
MKFPDQTASGGGLLKAHVVDCEHDDAQSRADRADGIVHAIGGVVAFAAVIAGVVLLVGDAAVGLTARAAHAPISAAPLLMVGAAFMAVLPLTRPGWLEFTKRAMVGAAFILWGIAQLMPPGAAATTLGDLVITLYVIDLALVIHDWRSTPPRM